ncbi:hypothetical protein CVS40_11947 [Lucilia cuprina]|nr:hypothetical protein CVS40_11947 [Lucilia cuprina]
MSPNDKIVCRLASCGKNITKTKGSICCDLCSKWYHASCVDGDYGDISLREELEKGLQGVQKIKRELNNQLKELKANVNKCNEMNSNLDITTTKKFTNIENQCKHNKI